MFMRIGSVVCVHMWVHVLTCLCPCFVPMPFLDSVSDPTCSVEDRVENPPAPAWYGSVICAGFWALHSRCRIITKTETHADYFNFCCSDSSVSSSSLVLSSFSYPPLPSLYIPHLCLLQPPPSPPFLRIPRWVGGKFNGDVGSQKGRGGFASYPSTVCVQTGASYRPIFLP